MSYEAHLCETSAKFSSARVHIERAIQRIRCYHILDSDMKQSMKFIGEQIFTACAYLTNLQAAILKQ